MAKRSSAPKSAAPSARKTAPAKTHANKAQKGNNPTVRLTAKQQDFANHFAIHGDAGRAYKAAYDAEAMSPDSVRSAASKVLKNDSVRTRIAKLQTKVVAAADERFDITLDKVMQHLAAAAFVDPADLFDWGTNEVPRFNRKTGLPVLVDGKQVIDAIPYARAKPPSQLTKMQRAAIAGVETSITATGERLVNVKVVPRLQALAQLKDILMKPDSPALQGVTVNVVGNAQVISNEPLTAVVSDPKEAMKVYEERRAQRALTYATKKKGGG